MRKKLQTWGYVASREASQEWLRGYRLGDGAKDGGAGVYVLSRQQLQRWYHVDKLSPTELQDKYRVECGVYADRAHLVRWLQVLPHMQAFVDLLYLFYVFFYLLSFLEGCHFAGFVLMAAGISIMHHAFAVFQCRVSHCVSIAMGVYRPQQTVLLLLFFWV